MGLMVKYRRVFKSQFKTGQSHQQDKMFCLYYDNGNCKIAGAAGKKCLGDLCVVFKALKHQKEQFKIKTKS